MDCLVDSPAVPKEGNGNEESKEDHEWKAHFWLVDAVILLGQPDDDFVAYSADDHETAKEAKANAQVGQAGDLGRPTIGGCVDRCDRGEEEIEEAVNKGHVGGEHGTDLGEEEHSEWTRDAVFEGGCFCSLNTFSLIAGTKICTVELFRQSGSFFVISTEG